MSSLGLDPELLDFSSDPSVQSLLRPEELNEERANVWVITHINQRFKVEKRFLLLPQEVFENLALPVTASLALWIHEDSP